jgi:hypothetical protein
MASIDTVDPAHLEFELGSMATTSFFPRAMVLPAGKVAGKHAAVNAMVQLPSPARPAPLKTKSWCLMA